MPPEGPPEGTTVGELGGSPGGDTGLSEERDCLAVVFGEHPITIVEVSIIGRS